jgi:ParB family transcriptional regulator, chromosome partitioning protein
MGKLDELRKAGAAAAAESMGAGVPLIPGVSSLTPASIPAHLQGLAKVKNVALIPVDKIAPHPDQPRKEFDEEALQNLSDSLRARGQLQAIAVRWDEAAATYRIVYGERRWRAAKRAGLPTLTAVIFDRDPSAAELLSIQVVENCLREDLKPLERARAFRSLMDLNGWTTRDVARELSIAQPQVVRSLALLDLPESVQGQVEDGALAPATAYEIAKLEDPDTIRAVAEEVVSSGLTRAETVQRVRKVGSTKSKGRGGSKSRPTRPRTFRTANGIKITLEPPRKPLPPGALLDAAREVVRLLEAEMEGQEAA